MKVDKSLSKKMVLSSSRLRRRSGRSRGIERLLMATPILLLALVYFWLSQSMLPAEVAVSNPAIQPPASSERHSSLDQREQPLHFATRQAFSLQNISTLPPVSIKLPTPIIVVGMPKVGTSSIHALFSCSGIRSSHYCCCGSNRTHTHCDDLPTFAACMRNNTKYSRPILDGCGDYQVYAQLDAERGRSLYLPQHFKLEELHEYAPEATFLLNLRPTQDWLRSITNWFGLGGRFLTLFKVDIHRVERNKVLMEIFDNHTAYVRDFVRKHPSHHLVEVDISSPRAGSILADAFGVDPSCWGKHNQNKKNRNP